MIAPKIRINLLILVLSTALFAQTKIDSTFSIEFPSKPEQYDFMDKNEHGTAYYLNNENDSFVVMRLVVDNKHTEYEKDFPNRKSLKKAYKKMIDVQIKAMSKKSFVFKDSAEITINDFIGYKITYQEEHSEN